MILSDIDIRMQIDKDPALIKPFHEECLQGASYDLSMSSKIAVFRKQVKTIDLMDQSAIDEIYENRELTSSGYVLNPGEYILAAVNEEVNIPPNLTAHIRPRTRFTRLGVLVSAQHCNPGYSGILRLGIYNASPNAIVLKPGIHIAQLIFEELLSTPSVEKQYQHKEDSAYMGEHEFRGAIFGPRELSADAKQLYDKILTDLGEA